MTQTNIPFGKEGAGGTPLRARFLTDAYGVCLTIEGEHGAHLGTVVFDVSNNSLKLLYWDARMDPDSDDVTGDIVVCEDVARFRELRPVRDD